MPIAYLIRFGSSYSLEEVEIQKFTNERVYFPKGKSWEHRTFTDRYSDDGFRGYARAFYPTREEAERVLRQKIESHIARAKKKSEDGLRALSEYGIKSRVLDETLLELADSLDYWKTVTFKQGGPAPQDVEVIEVGDPPQKIQIGTFTYPETDPDAEPPKKYGFELKTEFVLEDEEETKRIQGETPPVEDLTTEQIDAYVFLRRSGMDRSEVLQAINDPSIVQIVQDVERMIKEVPERIGAHLDKVGNEQALEDVLAALDNAQEGSNHDQRVFGFLNVFFFAYNRVIDVLVIEAFPDLNPYQKNHLIDKKRGRTFFDWFGQLDEDYQGRVLRWIFDNYEGLDFEKARRIAAVQTPPSRPGL